MFIKVSVSTLQLFVHIHIYLYGGRKVSPVTTHLTFSFRGIGCMFWINPSLGPYTRHMVGTMCNDMSTYSTIPQKNRTQVLYFDMSLYLLFVSYKGPVMD